MSKTTFPSGCPESTTVKSSVLLPPAASVTDVTPPDSTIVNAATSVSVVVTLTTCAPRASQRSSELGASMAIVTFES